MGHSAAVPRWNAALLTIFRSIFPVRAWWYEICIGMAVLSFDADIPQLNPRLLYEITY